MTPKTQRNSTKQFSDGNSISWMVRTNWVIKTGEGSQPGINGGLTGKDPHSSDPSSRMTNTIDVPSIEDFSKKIIAKGGKVMAKVPIPNMGLLAICKDNEGISFGILQKDPNVK